MVSIVVGTPGLYKLCGRRWRNVQGDIDPAHQYPDQQSRAHQRVVWEGAGAL